MNNSDWREGKDEENEHDSNLDKYHCEEHALWIQGHNLDLLVMCTRLNY